MRKKPILFSILRLIVKSFFPRMRVCTGALEVKRPAIFAGNHARAFGPIALYLYLPYDFRPWIVGDLFERASCAMYLAGDFTSKDLALASAPAMVLARIIQPIVIWLVKQVRGIPVYKQSRKILGTMDQSLSALVSGESLLVFPEKPNQAFNQYVNVIDTGFVGLAERYRKVTGRALYIYPVTVKRRQRVIEIDSPLRWEEAVSHQTRLSAGPLLESHFSERLSK